MPSKYTAAGGKTKWLATWRDRSGTQRMKRGFNTSKEAKDYEAEMRTDVSRGVEHSTAESRRVHIATLLEEVLTDASDVAPSTAKIRLSTASKWIEPHWRRTPLEKVTTAELEAWLATIKKDGAKPDTVAKAHALMKRTLKLALKRKLIHVDPMPPLRGRPKASARPISALTHAQVDALAAEIDPRYRTVVYFLAYTGVRIGELMGLQVRDVNLTLRTVSVSRSIDEKNGMHVGPTKNGKARVSAYPAFMDEMIADAVASRDPGEWLFVSPLGYQLRGQTFRNRFFKPAADRLENQMIGGQEFPHTTPHVMRHTAASLALRSGVKIDVLKNLLGHGSAAFTIDRYGHVYTGDIENAMSEVDNARALELMPVPDSPGNALARAREAYLKACVEHGALAEAQRLLAEVLDEAKEDERAA